MGLEIFYCARCAVQIRGAEAVRARALRLEDRLFCPRCRELAAQTPPKPTAAVRATPMAPR